MGGVDGGARFDSTTSPRQAAIQKAQAELRQEYDVREERKRELEFLEKGGNPLDFKFFLSASISVQSTSVTDQLLEKKCSEAKGSVALATSPHGESAESSGYPRAPSLREPNFADNLLLFDGETRKADGKRNGINTGKRKRNASSEHLSKIDGNNNIRETERETGDSTISHSRMKSQAYARRNRLRTCRDYHHSGPTDLTESGQGNQTTLSSTEADGNDVGIHRSEALVDDHIDSQNISCEIQLGKELDAVQQEGACTEWPLEKENITSEKLHENNFNDRLSLDGTEQVPGARISTSSKLVIKGGETITNGVTQAPCESAKQLDSISGFNNFNKDANILQNQKQVADKFVIQAGSDISTQNGLAAEPTFARVNHAVDGVTTGDHFYSPGEPDVPGNGGREEKKPGNESNLIPVIVRDDGDLTVDDAKPNTSKEQNMSSSYTGVKNEECCDKRLDMHDGLRSMSIAESTKVDGEVLSKPEGKLDSSLPHVSNAYQETPLDSTRIDYLVSPICEHLEASLSQKDSEAIPAHQSDAGEDIKVAKSHEESILQEARLIEIKLRKAGEAPLHALHLLRQKKSHWDYVLEEMAWLANDFMQERLWKITTASQICHMVARSGRSKFEKNTLWQKQKSVAQFLAKAVIRFWSSAEVLPKSFSENKNMDENMQLSQLPIKRYAARFLQSESCAIEVVPAEAPKTPDRTSDAGSLEIPREEQLPDELLFYKVPFGAMHVYRESVEANWLNNEKIFKITNYVDCETSMGDSAAEIKMYENMDDNEAETTMYYMSGSLEGNRPKISHKKRKILHPKAGSFDLPHAPGFESKLGTHLPSVVGKRTSGNFGSIPTKRVRTASRQRIISPFSISSTGAVPVTSKTDVSSGDTNSFPDDQSTLQGSFCLKQSSEFESTVDFEKQLPFDGNEVPVKSKKKKKPKFTGHKNLNSNNFFASTGKLQGSSYDQRWPVDSYAQVDQKDHVKKRLESRQVEFNGTNGPYMHQAAKKPKTSKQFVETSPEAFIPPSGSIPSPVASQMSNMSNSNKLIKVISNRERGRKIKALKVLGGQSGPANTWSLFEDQNLVVLVHDMGPNWELISDAINTAMQFKSVFRDPKACKDRHKILMDKNAGDGGDSAEDSGSSQPYASTLPGIPKGSARQLFECLQGPMEEDILKDHFEKIIHIGQKLHSHRSQDNLDSKQISPAHNSHLVALSQACPNNLAGGPLTPLDLCDATASNSAEVIGLGYQVASSSGLALPSYQGSTNTILPASSANSMLQGSPAAMVMGNNFPNSTAPNAPTRDVPRYGIPRPASLPVDDQQRLHQYGQVISGRNVPSALSVGADHGVQMLSGVNGMSMVCGMGRGMPLTRPGFQGIGSPGSFNMVSSGSLSSSTSVGIPSPVNAHPVSGHGQSNSMMRPRDSLQMMRSGQNPEDHKHMMIQELQQVTQGNGQTISPFNSISAPFSNQPITSAPVQSFPVQQHQPHHMAQQPHMLGNPHIQGSNHNSPRQQVFAMRMAKERQLQQQRLGQPSFAGPNGMTPMQNSPQPQTAHSSTTITSSSSHVQQKPQNLPHNSQTTAGMASQIKQRQRQQILQQPPRQQQPPPSQSKLIKGTGRGNILIHQNSPVEASHVNGTSATGNQVLDKHILQQNQSTFSGNPSTNSKPQNTNQQKIYGRPLSQSSKQMSAEPSHPDGVSQGQVQVPSNQVMLSSQQVHVPPLASQNQAQRKSNQNHQTMHRFVLHQNHKLNSDNHVHSASSPARATHMMVSPTKSSDSVNAMPDVSSAPASSVSQWKSEQPYETSSRTPSTHLPNSSQPILVGKEQLMPASTQGLAQRQLPGSLPVHGTGGPWQQQQLQPQKPQQQQQQQQLYHPHQQMHRQANQGALYGRPSNTGPG